MAASAGKTVLSGMVEKVAFVNKWPMLIKATSDDSTPTPGYLYQEITDLSYVSAGYCTSLLDFLVDRLEKSSFHIKVKVLRVMKHVVETGHNDFRNGLRRQAVGIQNAIKFSGDPDPLHGTAPYVAVRKAATDLSEVLFDTEQSKKASSPKRRPADQSKMQGFGNTPTHQPHPSRSLSEVLKGGVEQLTSNLTSRETTYEDRRTRSNDYQPIGGLQSTGQRSKKSKHYRNISDRTEITSDGYKAVDINGSEEETKTDGFRAATGHPADRPGGSWADHNIGSHGSNDSSGHKSAASMDLSEKLASVAIEDWSQEVKLVEDFVSSSNVKATPSREELNQFSKRCSTTSCEKVLELLDNKLAVNSLPSSHMRSLCAIEGILREDLVSAEKAQETLQANLRSLSNSQDKLVQAKAKKIARQLDRLVQEALESTKSRTTSPLHQAGSFADNLVPISPDKEETLPMSLATKEPSLDKGMGSTSLFSGMSLGQNRDLPESEDPFGIRTASGLHMANPDCRVSSNVDSKPKKSCENSLLLDSTNQNTSDNVDSGAVLSEQDSLAKLGTSADHTSKESVLDGLLDLSTTEQATLQPLSSSERTSMSATHLSLKTGSPTVLVTIGASEQSRSTERLTGIESELTSGTKPSASDSTKQSHVPMSRMSHLDELLSSIDPLAKSTAGATDKAPVSAPGKDFATVVSPSKRAGKSIEEITKLYPQLSRTQLSGTSTVPLSLSKKPQTKSFAFVETEEDKKEKRTKKGQEDAFGFVHDAMAKASKR